MTQPYNPYSAPQAAPVVSSGLPPDGNPQPWEPGEVVTLAWERFKSHWLVLVVAYLIQMVVTQVVSIGVSALAGLQGESGPALFRAWEHSMPGTALSFLVQAFFMAGFLRMCLDAARGQTPRMETLFLGGDRMAAMLGLTLLLTLGTVVGLVLLLVPGIIFGLGMFVAPFYVVDAKMGPIEAMRASWAATTGYKGNIFLLWLAFFGISIVGALACCVGLLAVGPLCYLATAIVFTRLSGRGIAVAPLPSMQG